MKSSIYLIRLIGSVFLCTWALANNSSWAILKDEKKAVILDDTLKIKGSVEKPEAYFILQRKNFDSLLNAQATPRFDAIGQIVDAVQSDIFK